MRFLRPRDHGRAARWFHALSDETRLAIVRYVADGEQCVCRLTAALKVGQSRLSFHLRTLRDAGILRGRREGRWIYYSLDPVTIAEAEAALGSLRAAALRRRGAAARRRAG